MKKKILSCALYIARFGMEFIYFFIKLLPIQKNKITMLSRQSNEINVDFEMILDEIKKEHNNIKVKILCKKISQGFINKIGYCFYIVKCMYHIATSKVCIIDGYVIPISALKHKKGLIIVQLWHAMGAIKQFGRQVIEKAEGSKKIVADIMKMHMNYTYIMCTSSATKKFYAEGFQTDENKILTLGMPRIDYLLGRDNKIDDKVNRLLSAYPILKEKKLILYVPTFRKDQNNTHIYDLIDSVDKEKYNLIIRLHPLDSTKIDKNYTVSKEHKTFELLKIADYVITDYSAVAFEACTLDKPLFFYLYDIGEYKINRGLNINLKEEMPESTFSNIKEIMKIIENDKYNYEELRKFKEKYVETVDMNNTKRIVDYIVNVMEE